MRAAIIENGVVVNLIVVDSLADAPGAIDAMDAAIGDGWNGTAFVKPPAPAPTVPQAVPMRNAQRVLYAAGLLATVEDIINAMPGAAGDLARIDWRTAQTIRRDDPAVLAVTPLLGKTEAEIDALFVAAAAFQ